MGLFCLESGQDRSELRELRQQGVFRVPSLVSWRLLFHVCAGVMAGLINRHPNPMVFGNSLLFYCMLPYLKKDEVRIDLLYASFSGGETLALSVLVEIDKRLFVDHTTLNHVTNQYASLGLKPDVFHRLTVIVNATAVPKAYPEKNRASRLRALFGGRGSASQQNSALNVSEARQSTSWAGIYASDTPAPTLTMFLT